MLVFTPADSLKSLYSDIKNNKLHFLIWYIISLNISSLFILWLLQMVNMMHSLTEQFVMLFVQVRKEKQQQLSKQQ